MIKYLILIITVSIAFTSSAQNNIETARELAGNGEFKKAVKVIDEILITSPTRASYYMYKANCQLELKDYLGAMETLTTAITINPDSISLYDMRGTLLEAMGLYDEAIRDFTVGYKKSKDDKEKSHLLSNRAGSKFRTRDFEGSYSDLIIAIKLDSTNIDVLNNLAAVCDEVNRPDETLEYLEQIISINPDYTPAYINIGFKYQVLAQYAKSITYFDKAIMLNPNEALAYSNRSFSKLKLKDNPGAMKDINQSIELLPSNSYAYKIRALIQIENGNGKKACLDLSKAKELGYLQQHGDEVEQLISKHCKN